MTAPAAFAFVAVMLLHESFKHFALAWQFVLRAEAVPDFLVGDNE